MDTTAFYLCSPNCEEGVCMEMGCGLDGCCLIWSGDKRFFSTPQHPNRIWLRALSPGVKRPGREADHSPPSSAEVRNGGTIPTPPGNVFMA
jgi:hypothetical protein